jgi:hypothetical protein
MAILGRLTITLLLLARPHRNSSPHLGIATLESVQTEYNEYETVEGNSEYETEEEVSEYETEEEDYEYETVNMGPSECPVPEYATHPGDYDYIPDGEFFLFRQIPQLLIDTIAHAMEAVRYIEHQLRYSNGDRTTELLNLRMDIQHGPLTNS